METLHEITDRTKVTALAAVIDSGEWPGPPLVYDGDQLLTGTHRYAAARTLEMIDAEIPMIDVRDVFAEADMDFEALWHEYGEPTSDQPYYLDLIAELPREIRDRHGLDMH